MRNYIRKVAIITVFAVVAAGGVALASHSWASYHWARQSNPFTVKLGDNVSSTWDAYLNTASSDWSVSRVFDTTVVSGGTDPKRCRPTSGRVEVCSAKYGFNGWLGLAQIWLNRGGHITRAVTKLNDTYFNTTTYNTPGWRSLVMCQEIGHDFGLNHQDENFSNANLGSCMDYTSDPDGTLNNQLSNTQPNAHDYAQLELIYAHLDSTTTLSQSFLNAAFGVNSADFENASEWRGDGYEDGHSRTSHYENDLGNGNKVLTFIFWAE